MSKSAASVRSVREELQPPKTDEKPTFEKRKPSLKRSAQDKDSLDREKECKSKKKKKANRERTEIFRNPKKRKMYPFICFTCQLRLTKNQCVYTTRKHICQSQGCGPKNAPKMMRIIKQAIECRSPCGANVREMAYHIRTRCPAEVPGRGLQTKIKCTIVRMIALDYLRKNPKDCRRYILTPQGRKLHSKCNKLKSNRSAGEYREQRKKKRKTKRRILRQQPRRVMVKTM